MLSLSLNLWKNSIIHTWQAESKQQSLMDPWVQRGKVISLHNGPSQLFCVTQRRSRLDHWNIHLWKNCSITITTNLSWTSSLEPLYNCMVVHGFVRLVTLHSANCWLQRTDLRHKRSAAVPPATLLRQICIEKEKHFDLMSCLRIEVKLL
jgi:hypothetical protein